RVAGLSCQGRGRRRDNALNPRAGLRERRGILEVSLYEFDAESIQLRALAFIGSPPNQGAHGLTGLRQSPTDLESDQPGCANNECFHTDLLRAVCRDQPLRASNGYRNITVRGRLAPGA